VAGPFKGHSGGVNSVAFSLDGAHIASGSLDNTIRIWDAATGKVVAGPFKGHAGWVNCVAFSPDGTCIISGSSDSTIRVWEIPPNLNLVSPPDSFTCLFTCVILLTTI
jgi:WD40 repeat protein